MMENWETVYNHETYFKEEDDDDEYTEIKAIINDSESFEFEKAVDDAGINMMKITRSTPDEKYSLYKTEPINEYWGREDVARRIEEICRTNAFRGYSFFDGREVKTYADCDAEFENFMESNGNTYEFDRLAETKDYRTEIEDAINGIAENLEDSLKKIGEIHKEPEDQKKINALKEKIKDPKEHSKEQKRIRKELEEDMFWCGGYEEVIYKSIDEGKSIDEVMLETRGSFLFDDRDKIKRKEQAD